MPAKNCLADDTTATSSQASTGIDPQLTLTGGNRLLVGQHQQLIGRVINNTVHPRWSSSNPRVIKVNQSGEIKGLKAGKATVKISYHNVAKYKTIRVVQ
ncbi:Ig-like domain-containing protein [Lentilactobacillus senioris]|uniref:Ig-like domain-containing protein n=1 Tax=Lentilactobacillus senioris TaxID=931534 RepID=UPI0006CFA01E|nr:Ig-like domain-containing protein [Lentilactobacillus senioris]